MNERLRFLRTKLGLNQRDFSKKTKLGQSTLAMFETGQRLLKDIHIAQICQTFNVNEYWLRTGEGEIFNKTDDTLLNQLSTEYKLNENEKKIINTYLQLSEKSREKFTDFVVYFINEFIKNNSPDISATIVSRPIVEDKKLTREQKESMMKEQLDKEDLKEKLSASTFINGLFDNKFSEAK